jgi:hypothetical protein
MGQPTIVPRRLSSVRSLWALCLVCRDRMDRAATRPAKFGKRQQPSATWRRFRRNRSSTLRRGFASARCRATPRRLRPEPPRTALPAFDTNRPCVLLLVSGEGVAARGFRQDHRTRKPAAFGPSVGDFQAEGGAIEHSTKGVRKARHKESGGRSHDRDNPTRCPQR